ncbi:hypothetical protein KKC88_00205 [Patescibacteria group bacterium]|nr:hypothetical protein [Patescibacteria group bacterium]
MTKTREVSDHDRQEAKRRSEELCDELDALQQPRPTRPTPKTRNEMTQEERLDAQHSEPDIYD